jgi:hypothetical protein
MMLSDSERKHILDRFVVLWQREVEPAQRIALAKLIGSVALGD